MKLKFYLFITVLIYALSSNAQLPFIYEGFDYNSGAQINGQTGGFGWQGGWQTSTGAETAYTVTTTNPFTYTNGATLPITPGRMVGGSSNNIIGRYLNTATNGPFAPYLDANGSIAPKAGVTNLLYFSFIVSKTTNNDDQVYYSLSNGLDATNIQNPMVSFGYFGVRSNSPDGKRNWSIRVGDNYYVLTPIVAAQKEYFVIYINYQSTTTSTICIARNPPISNGNLGGPWLLLNSVSTIYSKPFKSIFLYSEGTGGSFDEILAGPNFNSIAINTLPPTVLNGVNGSGNGTPGTSTTLNDTWRMNGNGATNPVTQFLGTTDNQDLNIRTNNVNRVQISKDGNTHFYGNSIVDGVFNANNGLNVNGPIINNGQQIDLNKLNYWTLTGNNLSSTNSGNVGIGTPNPTEKLQVNGNGIINGNLTVTGDISTNGTLIDLTANSIWKSNSTIIKGQTYGPSELGWQTCMAYGGSESYPGSNPDYTQPPYCTANITLPIKVSTTYLQELTIYADKTNLIEVSMNNLNTDNINTNKLTSGTIGIGITHPSEKLEVAGKIKTQFLQVTSGSGVGKILTSDVNGNATWGDNNWNMISRAGSNYFIIAPDNEANCIAKGGTVEPFGDDLKYCAITDKYEITTPNPIYNVGIGTSSPTSKLDVAGNITAEGLLISGTAGINYIQFPDGSKQYTAINSQWSNVTGGITYNDNVGIGMTGIPSAKLHVVGNALITGNIVSQGRMDATEFHACVSPGTCPDFVFSDTYSLMDLESLRNYIIKNKHLPDVVPAKTMEQNGMNINEMNLLLLRKVEEITLYVLQLESEIQKLKAKK